MSHQLLRPILKTLNITGTSSRVYDFLLHHGASSARRIAEHLSLPRPSIYDSLKELVAQSLVNEQDIEGKKQFHISDPLMIQDALEKKRDHVSATLESFQALLPELKRKENHGEPKLQFFLGEKGVSQVLNDLYWFENTEIRSMFSVEDMYTTFGVKNFERSFKKRIQRKNYLRTIYPSDGLPDYDKYPWLRPIPENFFEARIAPKGMKPWHMSFRMYANRITFISTCNECYAFRVQSNELTELMSAQFEYIWSQSKPVKI